MQELIKAYQLWQRTREEAPNYREVAWFNYCEIRDGKRLVSREFGDIFAEARAKEEAAAQKAATPRVPFRRSIYPLDYGAV